MPSLNISSIFLLKIHTRNFYARPLEMGGDYESGPTNFILVNHKIG